jgi:hypothetical protein
VQSVAAGWTAEERDPVRSIAHNLQVSWKKFSTLSARTFTIGVSTIGGNDIIGINPGAIGSPGNYKYFDESQYVLGLGWERGLNMPLGGLTKALAEAELDNTSGRFTPRYMGGNSELFTAILPRRPMIINAGFDFGGVDQVIPQFAGTLNYAPEVRIRNKTIRLRAADYVDFFQNRYLDQEVMFTSQTTDTVLETLMTNMGMNTAQYDLDPGINIIPFGLFEKGTRFGDIINQLVQAENGHFYQDESGIFKFENRQHWDSSPYTQVQRIILTGQVINAEAPNMDHLINVVEIKAQIKQKQPAQTIFNLPALTFITVPGNSSLDQFFEFQDAVLQLTDPTNGGANSYFVANSASDETGTDLTSSIQVNNLGTFAKSVKYRFTNTSSYTVYITQLVLSGRVAKHTSDLYYRQQDDSSVTAYEEQPLRIENDYIQNESWAASLSQMLLTDYSDVENLQKITIRAIPELQLGDLVSWQGRYFRIYNIAAQLNPSVGFVQELTMLQRQITSYFRIGISVVGGTDKIAP